MTFANLTELTLLGLAPENYSALQSTEPQKWFYSPKSEEKPSTASQGFRIYSWGPVSHLVLRADSISGKNRHTHLHVCSTSAAGFWNHHCSLWEICKSEQKYQNSHAYLTVSPSLWNLLREGPSLLKSTYNPSIHSLSSELHILLSPFNIPSPNA